LKILAWFGDVRDLVKKINVVAVGASCHSLAQVENGKHGLGD